MQTSSAKFQSVSRTHAGNIRACNEDALIARPELGLWAVSDGMGGHAKGDVASALVVDSVRQLKPNGSPLIDNTRTVIARANTELYRRGSAISHDATMGATVVALGMEGKNFFGLWAGDSRLYLFRAGKLSRLTRDHRYIQDLIDSGVLRESEAETHPRRSVITRAVGIEADVKLDTCEGALEKNDVFLLVTDGVTGVCRDSDLTGMLNGSGLDEAADRIVERCLMRGAPDNLSLILVKMLAV